MPSIVTGNGSGPPEGQANSDPVPAAWREDQRSRRDKYGRASTQVSCFTWEVHFADGRSSQVLLLGRSTEPRAHPPQTLDRETALERAEAVARAAESGKET